jgi:S-adenosylmethionine-diacylgycerolhomoserine-N-methlytransferase
VELGAGTGHNAETVGVRLVMLERLELVDLCPALLEQARARAQRLPNVVAIEADATRYRPASPADCAYFSYSLTMIPDWRAAIDNAIAMLRPGSALGAVDFHLPEGEGALARRFWPLWFARSGVRLSREHLPYLRARLDTLYLREWRAPLPYLPYLRAPVYLFVGRRRERAR